MNAEKVLGKDFEKQSQSVPWRSLLANRLEAVYDICSTTLSDKYKPSTYYLYVVRSILHVLANLGLQHREPADRSQNINNL